ncbi:L-serine ammonia-lyase [bacterium]|nr:L-serine ammonia-lyase [bacterium]
MEERIQPPVRGIREIYRIGMGPSSSHSMGPRRAAEIFRDGPGKGAARYRVTLYGSLAATGKGHLTDVAVHEALRPAECRIIWKPETFLPRHPNGLRLEALDSRGKSVADWTVFSTGGGELTDDTGVVGESERVVYPFQHLDDLLLVCAEEQKAIWQVVEALEGDIRPWLGGIWRAMVQSVERGLGLEGVLPGPLKVTRRAPDKYRRAAEMKGPLRETGFISAYALAVIEENAAGGTIVTAPTCGSAGVLPGLLYYLHAREGVPEADILNALIAAGAVGAFIKANASISGAQVGCQGEVGAACSMAAAAAAQVLGGTPRQVEYAAEMAMEHSLGMTCDPILGYVQIPCIERNAAGATRAFTSAGYALQGDGTHRISFDEVIETMRRTGEDMSADYRETSRAGLAALRRRGR